MLRDDYPKLNLKTGDRLEPCASLQDVGAFEDISSFPCQVLFWRASLATMATRRNPIFGEQTGCSTKCIAIDILHCLYLGVMQRIVSELLWRLLDVNAWRVQGSVINKHSLSMNRLRHDLANFYEARSREARRGEGDGEELTEVIDFQEKHIGTNQKHAEKERKRTNDNWNTKCRQPHGRSWGRAHGKPHPNPDVSIPALVP